MSKISKRMDRYELVTKEKYRYSAVAVYSVCRLHSYRVPSTDTYSYRSIRFNILLLSVFLSDVSKVYLALKV